MQNSRRTNIGMLHSKLIHQLPKLSPFPPTSYSVKSHEKTAMHLPSHFIDKEHEKQPIYFWNPDGTPQAFLSQWYPCHFAESDPASTPDPQEGGKKQKMIKYKTTEMYMMYRKALLFGDLETGRKILGNSHFARKVACDEHHKNEINRVMSGLTSHELSNVISPEATTPAEQRDLGRQVKDFNSKIWNESMLPLQKHSFL